MHTGEVTLRGTDIGGVGVHTSARVMETAAPGEVLVTQTVRDLVAGSGLCFVDRGDHHLRGLPHPVGLAAAQARQLNYEIACMSFTREKRPQPARSCQGDREATPGDCRRFVFQWGGSE